MPSPPLPSLFVRQTQALAVVTLGDDKSAQKLDNVQSKTDNEMKRFYLQYFFPPSSVGETGRVGAPGRRELGHGELAERALLPVIPEQDDFPYTMRVESTITESNGSSSMASVCGGNLALRDAGVPLKTDVAGVAMGLILNQEDGSYAILSDILGNEDALGDMDFKVAGDAHNISAVQVRHFECRERERDVSQDGKQRTDPPSFPPPLPSIGPDGHQGGGHHRGHHARRAGQGGGG